MQASNNKSEVDISSSTEWTTYLKGAEGFHCAIFHPHNWDGRVAAVGATLPNHLQFCFRNENGERCAVGAPIKQAKLKVLIREACSFAVRERCPLVIHAKTLAELDKAVDIVARRLPRYQRIALERVNEGGIWRLAS